ncbi:MAG: hypothetical protein Q4E12_03420 [Coriobacteriia bacterium]|nr:hypothetical protein [Coriobacteriia bacterium]
MDEVLLPASQDGNAPLADVPSAVRYPDPSVLALKASQPEAPARARRARKQPVGHGVLVALVAAFAVLLVIIQNAVNAYDNDMWWLLATGKDIVENGIPYTNPFSMHEGLGIVVQQWLAAVILYACYSAFGLAGAQMLVFVQQVVLVVCLYALCAECRQDKKTGGEINLLLIALSYGALSAYITVRPHLYTMIMFALVLLVLEKYRHTNNRRWLVLLPVLVCVHANLHSSMAVYDLFIIALYVIPDVFALLRRYLLRRHNQAVAARVRRQAAGDELSAGVGAGRTLSLKPWPFALHEADYSRLPLLIALVVCAVALLVNPYGINGVLYLVNSYGVAGYSNYINEMGNTGFWTDYGGFAMACIVVGSIALGVNGLKRINLPLTLLFAVAIPLSMMHTRNVWLVAFFAVPLAAQAFSRARLYLQRPRDLHSPLLHGVCAVLLAGIAVAYAAFSALPNASTDYEKDSGNVPVVACDYLDTYVQETGTDAGSLKIYNSFNNGGYLEWRGYKVFIDPRPELWEPGITGVDRHYYKEFVDFAQGRTPSKTLIDEYQFDFLVVYNNSDLAKDMEKYPAYEMVCTGSGYKLWQRR